jgi:hypothetical protein
MQNGGFSGKYYPNSVNSDLECLYHDFFMFSETNIIYMIMKMNNKAFSICLILAILLISGCATDSGSPQPGSPSGTQAGGSPTTQAAFEAYRDAIADRDVEALKRSVAASTILQMQTQLGPLEENADMIFDLLGKYAPTKDDIAVESEDITGDTAVWVISDKSDPSMSGIVTFSLKNGAWKVVKESWSNR